MAYKALYRKYRPIDFEDFTGQKHVLQTLKNSIEKNKIAHAYLFSGPRGTGKTSMAKLFAKAINCTGENKPCNQCENCIAINENSHPDIIEIDAASNNGVDEIRDLVEKVKYAPLKGKYKVYIIDEVHMMTPGAFNALLKTLEEPPAHVVFILATTDVHKVLPTVLSRCQRFDFNKLSFNDIKNRLEEVMKKENIEHEEAVSSLIAELAEGGMRDALSILDQVLSYATNNLKLQDVYDIYGIISTQEMCDFLNLLINGKTQDVLERIESFIDKGIDIKRLTYDLMIVIKDSILFRATSDEKILEKLNKDQASQLLHNYKIDDSIKLINIFNEALGNYRVSTNYRLFFELASLKAIESLSTFTLTKNSTNISTSEEIKEAAKVEKSENVIVESTKEPILEETLNREKYETNEKTIEYNMMDYINIVSQGDKKFKMELNSRWQEIKQYLNDPTYGNAAKILVDSVVGAANKEYVFLVFNYEIQANRAKKISNLLTIRSLLRKIFVLKFEVYVADHSGFVDITTKYFSLRQANKLPPITPIPHLDDYFNNENKMFEEKEEKNENTEPEDLLEETIEIGKEFFGDILNIKEDK